MIPLDNQPSGYWAHTLYLDPRKRPKSDAPLKDLPQRAAQRFKAAREGVRGLRHVTEQIVFLGTAWKWVWMYEIGGRKLGYLHPMASSVSATFVVNEAEERELATSELPEPARRALAQGPVSNGVRWCWMEFPDLNAAEAFVHVVRLKHLILSRPE